VRVRVVD